MNNLKSKTFFYIDSSEASESLMHTSINKDNINSEKTDQATNIPDKQVISITIDDDDSRSTEEYGDALLGVDILGPYKKQSEEYEQSNNNNLNSSIPESVKNTLSFNSLYGVLLADQNNSSASSIPVISSNSSTNSNSATPTLMNSISTATVPNKNSTNNISIPLKLITILNNTKKEVPTKIELPQRKNNKIIDPTDEPLVEDTDMPASTEMPPSVKTNVQKNENLTKLNKHHEAFLSGLSRPTIGNADQSPVFLSRPINKLSPSFISTGSFPGLNSLESKHNFQTNPIRSELDLIIDVDKLNLNGETKIFTPPHKDPAGLLKLKLAGCNIYGRMYRVGRIIAELSNSCLECRCTEVGVSCTPLNC